MTTVLEEVTSDTLSREHVERRLWDWVQRIDSLYDSIALWLPEGWRAERSGSVTMEAQLMRRFDVPPREIPMLQIMQAERPVASVEPRDLWIIGANGRLDLHQGRNHYIIVDTAENFQPPVWTIVPLLDRSSRKPFDRAKLLEILRNAPTS